MVGTNYKVIAEIESGLDFDSMTLHEIVHYAVHNPGASYEMALTVNKTYSEAKKGALLETAALMGALDEDLFKILQRDSI